MSVPDRLVCRETDRATLLAMTAEGRLVDLRVVRKDRRDLGDRLFLGRLERVHADLKAGFVDIGEGRSAYLRAEDLVGFDRQWPPPGTPLLLQIRRDSGDDKGPRASMNVSIGGRFLVYHPHGEGIGFSRRILQETERVRLRDLVLAAGGGGAVDGGFVLRTAAEGAPDAAVQREVPELLQRWEAVRQRILAAAPPVDLTTTAMPDTHPLLRAVRDHGRTLREIVLDDRALARRVQELVDHWQDETQVDWQSDGNALLDIDDIVGQIEAALSPRIVLPSGVEILFEPGRTLCAIDVDSGAAGSRQGQGPRRAVDVNLEAADTIASQLRLRNIGGIVLIDFINMRSAFDRDKVGAALAQRFAEDPVPTQIVGFTRLGLLEVTRAHRGRSLVQLVEDIAGFDHPEDQRKAGPSAD